MKALIVGAFEEPSGFSLTKNGRGLPNSDELLKKMLLLGPIRCGKSRVFQGILDEYPVISLVNIGPSDAGFNNMEQINVAKENVRVAVAEGLRSIRALDCYSINEILVDDCGDAQSAAEGIYLYDYKFDELKSEKSRRKPLKFELWCKSPENVSGWERGQILARGQNMARRWAEMPANLMTPTIFAEEVTRAAEGTAVKVIVHDAAWAESMKMGAFLGVTQGSDQPPKFIEYHYNNAPNTKPLVFVGKGITFDSGGISIKPRAEMDKMRADMTGAAVVASSILTLATLKAKVNVIGLTPMCENLLNGRATKPGDVHRAMNGKSIIVDNTDAEGRLILSDALCYADTFDAQAIVDIATLTGAIKICFGDACAGVWSRSDKMWELIRKSSIETADRVWRMPLFKCYAKEMTDGHHADIDNMGKSHLAGSSTAAGFLSEFTNNPNWMHLDISGVKEIRSDKSCLTAGLQGRPLRTMVQFIQAVFNDSSIP